jgi:cyclophilin family peptidyl-prolyl cis-trans isomerase
VSRKSNCSTRSSAFVENLEDRILMKLAHPTQVINGYFDNRGNVQLNMSVGIDPTTLSRKTAAIWLAGGDGNFGTSDDTRLYTAVGYRKGLITLRAATAVNQRYRVILNASVIKDINGFFLDGEFNGATVPSGNGVQGGNYDIVTNTAARATARFTTIAGNMNVALNTKFTKITTNNFAHYANLGAWDNSFFHRTEPGFVVQGGGYFVNGSNQIDAVHSDGDILNEPGISNTRGTIAMARAVDGNPATTNDQNSANTQWYFNTVNNSSGLDSNVPSADGGFTVFGAVADSASLRVMDALASFPRVDASSITSAFNHLPVRDPVALQSRQLNPQGDLIIVSRIAMLMDPTATPVTGVQRSLTTTQQTTTDSSTVQGTYTAATNPFLAVKDEKNALLE